MFQIFNAKAKRSGASITITGENVKGEAVRLADVGEIDFATSPPTATVKNGQKYAIVVPAPF